MAGLETSRQSVSGGERIPIAQESKLQAAVVVTLSGDACHFVACPPMKVRGLLNFLGHDDTCERSQVSGKHCCSKHEVQAATC